LGQRKGLSSEQSPQALALHELHDDVDLSVGLPNLVDGGDVGMSQLGGQPGLAEETVAGLGTCQEVAGQDFDGHRSPQHLVMGPIDHAHAAGADGVGDGELSELVPHQLFGHVRPRPGSRAWL